MRLTLAVAGTVLALTLPVTAADLGVYRKAPAPAFAPAFSWTGFYAGAQLGHTWGNDYTKEYLTNPWTYIGLINFYKPTGYSYGVHAGGNMQFGNVVLGVEADADFSNIRGSFVDPPGPLAFDPGGKGRTHVDLHGSLRVRLGYAFGRFMVYGTGGLALARFDSTYTRWDDSVSESITKTLAGYTVGAGIEYAVTNNITIRGEFRHTDYGQFRNNSVTAFPGITGVQRPTYNSVKVGASYKF